MLTLGDARTGVAPCAEAATGGRITVPVDGGERAAFEAFRAAYPAYGQTAILDDLRQREYGRLDVAGLAYLDYTGGGLYAASQLRAHQERLSTGVFGNPHSESAPSRLMSDLVASARARILAFFSASADEYDVIFTPNATGALRLVAESYPFGPGGHYLLTFDNHNSVNGIREFAWAKRATVTYIAVTAPDLRVPHGVPDVNVGDKPDGAGRVVRTLAEGLSAAVPGCHNLFAYPAQSNFSGVQHPLEWVATAQAAGWDVLLDAAAFVPTNRLDLSRIHPDYVSISFYKIFGYPTGVGALLVRRAALNKLRRPWYAGGNIVFSTVRAATGEGNGYYRAPGPAGFEDGTVNYLGILGVDAGLAYISGIGIGTIHTRVMCLTGWLLDALLGSRHSNGRPVVRVHGPADTQMRGATIAMNFHDPAGELIDSTVVESLANRAGIALRSGCHCNPGAREVAIEMSAAEMSGLFKDKDRLSLQEFVRVIDGKTTGAARASLGIASTFTDVYRFWRFAQTFRDRPASDLVAASDCDVDPAVHEPGDQIRRESLDRESSVLQGSPPIYQEAGQ